MSTAHSRDGALRGRERERVAAAVTRRFAHDRVPIAQLAAEIGRRPSMVRRLLVEAGIEARDLSCVGAPAAEVTARLVRRYSQGVSLERLSADTGLDRRVVRQVLTEAGVSIPEQHSLSAEQTDWAVEQYTAGATTRELAEQTDCSASTIYRALLAAGVPLRAPGQRRADHTPTTPTRSIPSRP